MNIEEYLPQVLKEIYEFRAVASAENKALAALRSETKHIGGELFIQTAEDVGLEKWEEALSLEVDDEDTAELRRMRILSELSGGMERLEAVLDSLVGSGNYTVSLYWTELRLVCRLSLSSGEMLEVVRARLEKLLPLNLVFDCLLMYRTWNLARDYTWDEVREISWVEIAEQDNIN
jgi:hypothetical protein